MTESIYNSFLLQPSQQLILLPDSLFDYIIKVFASHQPHYKEKLIGNLTCRFSFTTLLGRVVKKEEPLKIVLHLLSLTLKPLSLLFSSTFIKKCLEMSKWQYSSTLASILLLADYILKIMKLLYCKPKAGKHLFVIYYPQYKEELWMINTAYNSYDRYSFDKLTSIAPMYHPKASHNLSHAAHIKQFLSYNQVLSNK